MQRLRFFGLVLMFLALTSLASGLGCGGKDTGKPTTPSPAPPDRDKAGGKAEAGPLEWTGTATLKGQVTYDGDPPKQVNLNFPTDKPPDAHCLKGEGEHRLNLTWEVDPNSKGVKNVVVWVRPGDGKFFKYDAIPEALRKRTDRVTMDQPFCNFIPHVQAYNPSIFDGKKQVPTGQEFVVKNSAPITHNSKYDGDAALPATNSGNPTLTAGTDHEIKAKPARDSRTGDDVININCGIHPWMTAKLLVLDTPYYAITDKDGKFEIKDVPAGVEVYVVAWHEEAGVNNYLLPQPEPAKQGQKMTLDVGKDGTLNFKIKKN